MMRVAGVDKDGVRQRTSKSNIQDEDLDAILKYNRNIQEKIAENMLSMTSSMKEHALAANAIIKKDIAVMEKSDKLTDINAVKLKKESLRLEEHTNSKWRCWVWLMIAFVLVVFFSKYFSVISRIEAMISLCANVIGIPLATPIKISNETGAVERVNDSSIDRRRNKGANNNSLLTATRAQS